MLQGEFEFVVEDSPTRAGMGSLIYVPKGTLHAHENIGEGEGRMLATQTPGGLYEDFLEEAGKQENGDAAGPAVFEDRPGAANIVAIAARYGIEIPPVAQGGRA